MQPNLIQNLEKNWGKTESYSIRSPQVTAGFLLQCLALNSGDYIICDPLVPAYFIDALRQKNIQVIFIDLTKAMGNIDLDLLENFLSLSTLINENDELVYRKDEQVIKAIVTGTRINDPKNLQRFIFTAQRYYLKSLSFAELNDLLSSQATKYYQADLIVSNIQNGGQESHLVIKPEPQNRIPGISGPTNVINPPAIPKQEMVSLDEAIVSENTVLVQPEEPAARFSLQLPLLIPGYAKLLHQNRVDLRVHLTAKGFYLLPPFQPRVSELKESTFLSRSKAGQQYLDQYIKILLTTPKEVDKLKEVLKQYLKNTTDESVKLKEG
ncbi:MAG: hypothetical protein AAF705_07025 [Bacteroidota bacterium]